MAAMALRLRLPVLWASGRMAAWVPPKPSRQRGHPPSLARHRATRGGKSLTPVKWTPQTAQILTLRRGCWLWLRACFRSRGLTRCGAVLAMRSKRRSGTTNILAHRSLPSYKPRHAKAVAGCYACVLSFSGDEGVGFPDPDKTNSSRRAEGFAARPIAL